ncbi:MAG: type IV pilus secretin PilQ [Candidatus Sulfobium sp.]|jgi:type IV pilus assembly protein PilQ
MKRYILLRLLLPVILVALAAGCATSSNVRQSATEDEAVITGINLGDNSLAISSNKHFTYTIYSTDDPYRITVNIPDMSAGGFTSRIVSEKAGFTEVIPRQTPGSVKIDVVLQSPVPVEPSYKDNTLTIRVKAEEPAGAEGPATSKESMKAADEPTAEAESAAGGEPMGTPLHEDKISGEDEPAKATAEAAGETSEARPEKAADESAGNGAPSKQKATEITAVKLERSGAAVKVVISGNGTMVPNVFPLGKRIVIDIPAVTMNASLPESVISPLTGIRAGKHRHKIRVVLDLKEKTGFEVAAVGDSVEILLEKKGMVAEATPSAEAEAPGEAASKAATPPPLETPVGKIAAGETAATGGAMAKAGVKALGGGKYKGKKISLDFQDAEIGPIFRLLADVNGYNLVLDRSVHGRITIKLMNVPWDQALEIILNSTTPPLSYRLEGNILWVAPVSKFEALVKEKEKLRSAEENVEPLKQEIIRVNYSSASAIQSAISSGKLLSPRGSITIDSRMNTLIVKDTQNSIDKMKDLVKIMDVAKPQVMIEAKIVQVSNDYNRSLGIRWGGSFTTQTFPNVVDGNFSVNTPTVTGGPDQNSPGGTMGMTVGHANTLQVKLSLEALESIGKAKTLSNPKILTMDNESATIQQGKTFFIPLTSQAGPTTQTQQATLSLTVTPKIAPDGYVQLKVNATDNSLEPGTAGAQAVVDTKSLTTQALVSNGETLVLGGIYTNVETDSRDRVPLLGKIPVIGWLFKTDTKVESVSELLIFITPRIVKHEM